MTIVVCGCLLYPAGVTTAGVIVVWGTAMVVLLFESRMENSIRLSGSRRSGSSIALNGAGAVRVGGRPVGDRTALAVASRRVAGGWLTSWASGKSNLTCMDWLA